MDRITAAQEEDRPESKAAIVRHEQMERLAAEEAQEADLLVHQSESVDRLDKVHRDFTRQIVHLLNMILDRLTPHTGA